MAVAESILNVGAIRKDFPILSLTVHGKPLAYLDNAATAQKPRAVIEAITRYYETGNANVHRGVHALSQEATEAYERVRALAAGFLNVTPGEIVFTAGTTAGLNLVAQSHGGSTLRPGDEISFGAGELRGQRIVVDAAYVKQRLAGIASDEDLSRYIL